MAQPAPPTVASPGRTIRAAPPDARGIVLRILVDMAMVTWFEGEPGQSRLLNTEPFFLADLIETGEVARPAGEPLH